MEEVKNFKRDGEVDIISNTGDGSNQTSNVWTYVFMHKRLIIERLVQY